MWKKVESIGSYYHVIVYLVILMFKVTLFLFNVLVPKVSFNCIPEKGFVCGDVQRRVSGRGSERYSPWPWHGLCTLFILVFSSFLQIKDLGQTLLFYRKLI